MDTGTGATEIGDPTCRDSGITVAATGHTDVTGDLDTDVDTDRVAATATTPVIRTIQAVTTRLVSDA